MRRSDCGKCSRSLSVVIFKALSSLEDLSLELDGLVEYVREAEHLVEKVAAVLPEDESGDSNEAG